MKLFIALFTLASSLSAQGIGGEAGIGGRGGFGGGGAAVFTQVQATALGSFTCNLTCTSPAFTAVTAGNLLYLVVNNNAGTADILTAATIGGVSMNVPAVGTGDCAIGDSNAGTTACGYILSAPAGGATTAALTVAVNQTYAAILYEYHRSSGTWTKDTAGSHDNNGATTTTPPGVTLTLGGTNRLIFQNLQAIVTALPTINGCFGTVTALDGTFHFGAVSVCNPGASGTAPTWTINLSRNTSVGASAFF